MDQLFIQVVGGFIVAILVALFNIGGTKVTVVRAAKTSKTGKWIIIISVIMILVGLALMGQNAPQKVGLDFNKLQTMIGLTLVGYGILALIVGKIVAWFQKS